MPLELPDSLPEPSRFNVHWENTVSLTVPIEEAYAALGASDSITKVIKLSSICMEVAVQSAEYREATDSLESLKNPYNLDFSPTMLDKGLRRTRFAFTERLDYKVTSVDVKLVGCQIEVLKPDLTSEASTLYTTYAQKQKIWTRKTRIFSRLPSANGVELTRVHETCDLACNALMAPVVKYTGSSAHKKHMLSYADLFDKDVSVHLL